MRTGILSTLAIILLIPACSTPERTRARSTQPPPSPEPYVRIVNTDSNRLELQIALREFVPARGRGAAVWLAAVSHVGDTNYYAKLQTCLDRQSLVLFEGVGDGSAEVAPVRGGESATLQASLARSLGLVFQLDALDYSRTNFRNSDLSVQRLRGILAEQSTTSGDTGAGQSFEALLGAMQGGGWFDGIVQLGLRFLGSSVHLQALTRLALMELLGQIQGDPSRLGNLPPNISQLLNVLIEKRNQQVIADLRLALRDRARSGPITVLYGAAHMPDLERRLGTELAYRPAGQTWLTAFSIDLARTRVTPSEVQWIRSLVKAQLAQYQKRQ